MESTVDIIERLLADLECADTIWLVRANPTTLDMLAVGGPYTHGARRTIPRENTLTDTILAAGKDVVIIRDVWALDLPVQSRMALLASKAQSNLIAIVHVDGRPWGVLSATSSRSECPFGDEHIPLIRRAAEDVAARLARSLAPSGN